MAGPQETIQIVQESMPWWQYAIVGVIVPLALAATVHIAWRSGGPPPASSLPSDSDDNPLNPDEQPIAARLKVKPELIRHKDAWGP